MKSKQMTFFATKKDVLLIMERIENRFEIEYVVAGMFDSGTVTKYFTLKGVSDIGFTNFGSWISLDNRFIIVAKNTQINVREVPQRKGGTKFAIDLMHNPFAVELSTGGVYRRKHNILVAGRLAIMNDDGFSNQVYQAAFTEIKNSFRKINTCYVGGEAEEKLKEGWRLVTNEKSSKEYDLILG